MSILDLPLVLPAAPYRGMEPFRYVDSPIFFARREETRALLHLVIMYRGVLFFGDSGSGKSSLINAGLVPAVIEEGFTPNRVRVQPRRGEEIIVERIPATNGDGPPYLPSTFTEDDAEGQIVLSIDEFRKRLVHQSPNHWPLVIFDQFEELITLFEEASRGDAHKDALAVQDDILKLLAGLLRAPQVPVKLLFVFREDYLAKFAKLLVLCPDLRDQTRRLTRLRIGQVGNVIHGPFDRYPGHFHPELSPDLAEAVAADIEQRTPTGELTLSEVQVACLRLWQSDDPEALFRARGVQGLLEDYLADTLRGFPEELHDPAVALLSQLVTAAGTRNVLSEEDLLVRMQSDEQFPQDLARRALRALEREGKLVRRERRHNDYFYEIVSEFLVPWISEQKAKRQHQAEQRRLQQEIEIEQRRGEAQARAYRRQRRITIVAAALGLLALLGAGGAFYYSDRADAKRVQAEEANRRLGVAYSTVEAAANDLATSEAQARAAEQAIAISATKEVAAQATHEADRMITQAMQLSGHAQNQASDQTDLAALLALEAQNTNDSVDTRGALLTSLMANPSLIAYLRGHSVGVQSVAYSPDGTILASSGGDGTIILWDAATRRPRGHSLAGHPQGVLSLAFAPDGLTLAAGNQDGTVSLWDVTTGGRRGTPLAGHRDLVLSVAFSPDGALLASGSGDGTVLLWDVATAKQRGTPLTEHTDWVHRVAFSPDGRTLATASADRTVRLWNVADGSVRGNPLSAHTGSVLSLAFSPDGAWLASGGADKNVMLWDLADLEAPPSELEGHSGSVQSLAFSPDSRTLASGGDDKTILLWDAQGHRTLSGHTNTVQSLAFGPDGRMLASGGWDGMVLLWDITAPARMGSQLTTQEPTLFSVAASPDGTTLAAGGCGRRLEDSGDCVQGGIWLWDAATGEPKWRALLIGHTDWVYDVTFSPDGKTLASGGRDESVILWDIATGKTRGRPLTGHGNTVLSVAFSPDGKTLASGDWDGEIILWDVATGNPRGEPLSRHTARVESVAFSADGKTLASGSADGSILLWDMNGGLRRSLFPESRGAVNAVAFSPDSTMVAGGGCGRVVDGLGECGEGAVWMWEVASGAPLGQPLVHPDGEVRSVDFTPDGATLASGGADRKVRLWDVAAHRPRGGPLVGHGDAVQSVVFAAGGRLLGSAGDGLVLWDLDTGRQTHLFHVGHSGWVNRVAFSPDGDVVASASGDDTLIVWNADTNAPQRRVVTHLADGVRAVAISPDGETVAAAGCGQLATDTEECRRGEIQLWNLTTGEALGALVSERSSWAQLADAWRGRGEAVHPEAVLAMAFSPDGTTLASGSEDGSLVLWDLASRRPVRVQQGDQPGSLAAVTFSPDGAMLASGGCRTFSDEGNLCTAGAVWLWDAQGRPLGDPLVGGHFGSVLSVAFNPDGTTLASGSEDGTLILWDLASRDPIGVPLLGHRDYVKSVAFSPDGKMLASGSADGTIVLWDAVTRRQIGGPLTGHTDWVNSVAFRPDGRVLASGSSDTNVMLWDTDPESWRRRACEFANRTLWSTEWKQYLGEERYRLTCPPLLAGADAYAKAGDRPRAEAAFEGAVQWAADMNTVEANNTVCWFGSVDGFAQVVLPACERAVELAPDWEKGYYRDSRGLARALSGDTTGAIADFQGHIDWWNQQPNRVVYQDLIDLRASWIKALEAGTNPFDEVTLTSLRDELKLMD